MFGVLAVQAMRQSLECWWLLLLLFVIDFVEVGAVGSFVAGWWFCLLLLFAG